MLQTQFTVARAFRVSLGATMTFLDTAAQIIWSNIPIISIKAIIEIKEDIIVIRMIITIISMSTTGKKLMRITMRRWQIEKIQMMGILSLI